MPRVLVVVWDVHHGSGIQHVFVAEPRVLYVSLHRHDHGLFFPSSEDPNYDAWGRDLAKATTLTLPGTRVAWVTQRLSLRWCCPWPTSSTHSWSWSLPALMLVRGPTWSLPRESRLRWTYDGPSVWPGRGPHGSGTGGRLQPHHYQLLHDAVCQGLAGGSAAPPLSPTWCPTRMPCRPSMTSSVPTAATGRRSASSLFLWFESLWCLTLGKVTFFTALTLLLASLEQSQGEVVYI
ncbi:uncharacterized protein LOC126992933 [Eriocheir sinensis]|uniref:uncharacterized protein LOC126992933 n=1 Tax=Eriocheir sinensis TaxID=95602 RepID=UPI0021C6FE0B|nr:uncharacterized protein LOC126992933 [Eriocheir sinensis]